MIQHRFVVDPPAGQSRPLRQREREYVQLIVGRHRGDRRRAADELPTSLATLTRKLIEVRPPDTYRGQPLLNASPAFAQDARPLSTHSPATAYRRTLFRDLEANIQRSDAAIRRPAAGIGTLMAARGAIDAAIAGGLTAIQGVHAIDMNRLRYDPGFNS